MLGVLTYILWPPIQLLTQWIFNLFGLHN